MSSFDDLEGFPDAPMESPASMVDGRRSVKLTGELREQMRRNSRNRAILAMEFDEEEEDLGDLLCIAGGEPARGHDTEDKVSNDDKSSSKESSSSSDHTKERDYLKKYRKLKVRMHERDHELKNLHASLISSGIVVGSQGQLKYKTADGRLEALPSLKMMPLSGIAVLGISKETAEDTAKVEAEQRAIRVKKIIFLVIMFSIICALPFIAHDWLV
ncbi:hypothetical protein FOL47_000137 [Perkinsus chesapeaki]|uniref:Uncharacterized protein n=1 Tax=Perkinsus chesapeaki TaxID=330153 RepID=A0A7J6N1E9_PERCH|nr:hypothetical protein FOL47_000137 [Perkinsus chesapeaki]